MENQRDTSDRAPGRPSTASFRKDSHFRRIAALVLLGQCAILVLRYDGTISFWRNAWLQRTAFPELPGNAVVIRTAFQQPVQPFDLRKLTIPSRQILGGGPPKDGIPALTEPKQVAAEQATYLRAVDRVIGINMQGVARAYPLRILDYHEIVNDRIGDVPFAVTYCPLCDSAVVFDRRTELGEKEFGVSGLLYKSNVLLYDRRGKPESLWSQVMAEGVSGPGAKQRLKCLPLELTTWQDWLSRNPATTVLSTDTGHARNYDRPLYAAYFASPELMFPVKPLNRRLPAKTPVLGVWTANAAKAYPIAKLNGESKEIPDQIDGLSITLEYDAKSRTLRVIDAADGVQWMYSFWFAWAAFRPHTELYGRTDSRR